MNRKHHALHVLIEPTEQGTACQHSRQNRVLHVDSADMQNKALHASEQTDRELHASEQTEQSTACIRTDKTEHCMHQNRRNRALHASE